MVKKRKKGMRKKGQRRQRAQAGEKVLMECIDLDAPIERTDAATHKSIEEYFLAHPTKTSATLGEVVEFFVASAPFTLNSSDSGSKTEPSNEAISQPSPSKPNEINALEQSSVESKLLEASTKANVISPPVFGERILLLVLSKNERVNIPGDLEEEYRGIAAKHGARYAKLWYYKQVAASAWPLVRKAVGWGLVASIGTWLRRII